jgi:hypothetical protein
MTETDTKVYENYLRRWAKRLGVQLKKSRARWSLDNIGGYQIIDPTFNGILAGERFNLSLEGVDEYLTWLEKEQRKTMKLK